MIIMLRYVTLPPSHAHRCVVLPVIHPNDIFVLSFFWRFEMAIKFKAFRMGEFLNKFLASAVPSNIVSNKLWLTILIPLRIRNKKVCVVFICNLYNLCYCDLANWVQCDEPYVVLCCDRLRVVQLRRERDVIGWRRNSIDICTSEYLFE